jgi:hypothetical protein
MTLRACDDLLAGGRAPEGQLARIRENKRFAAEKLGFQI